MQYAAQNLPIAVWTHARNKKRVPVNGDFEDVVTRVLTQGGDTRIELNEEGVNLYGCGPRPDPALVQFGSSTGSVISSAGFQSAVAVYQRLYGMAGSYHAEVQRQRLELSVLSGASKLPGTEVVFAASGTDIHLIAAHLAMQGQSAPLQAVTIEPGETGSGVPAALAALHFAAHTAQGHSVRKGEPVANKFGRAPVCVRVRRADGSLRSVDEVDAEFELQVKQAIQADGRCLLVLTDLSKTGLLAPTPACACAMQKLYGSRLSVLVDACQFRLSHDALLNYLDNDFMVAVTGSKFIGGPAFCGALLVPPATARRCSDVALDALSDYCARSDWPPGWLPAKELPESANLGLLLRWEAALTELRRFKAIPDHAVHDFLQTWQQAVQQRFELDDCFELLPVNPLQRGAGQGQLGWDSIQTVFAFQVFQRRGGGRRALTSKEMPLLYQQLRRSSNGPGIAGGRFQLGQPVHFGGQTQEAVSALRLCSSARLVTESMCHEQPVRHAITQAMRALDQVSLLAQTFG